MFESGCPNHREPTHESEQTDRRELEAPGATLAEIEGLLPRQVEHDPPDQDEEADRQGVIGRREARPPAAAAQSDPGFLLPSQMSAAQLAALTGASE